MSKIFAVARMYGSKFATVGAGAVALVSGSAHAALDLTPTGPIGTAITAATNDGLSVGAMVIALVAALVVIGIVIALLRKA